MTKLTRLDALAGSLTGGAIQAAVVSSLAPRTFATASRAIRHGA